MDACEAVLCMVWGDRGDCVCEVDMRGWKVCLFLLLCATTDCSCVVMVWFELSVGGNWSCDSGELEYRQCLV